ncbi:class I SAM-dependent methyltransferase [Deinococcus cavernae]|nr:class I SAM-dependent methyltransferase [Deinococcus cavernae]
MTPEFTFTTEPMAVILPRLRQALEQHGSVVFLAPNPDTGLGRYAGEVTAAGLHRPLSAWVDLADLLEAHLFTPEIVSDTQIRVQFQQYAPVPSPDDSGYGPDGDWARVDKLEDPVFVLTFVEALRRVNPPPGGRVLALGVNGGRELDALNIAFPERPFEVVGVDIEPAALKAAKRCHPNWQFRVLDVNTLPNPALGKFDLIVALSLLQSPGVTQDVLLSNLRKYHLRPTGGLVLGFPNARYRDGHLSYGARMRNFARPDFSLLMADVTNARRGLQKHGFKVFVTGKYEVLLTAIPATLKTPGNLNLEVG